MRDEVRFVIDANRGLSENLAGAQAESASLREDFELTQRLLLSSKSKTACTRKGAGPAGPPSR